MVDEVDTRAVVATNIINAPDLVTLFENNIRLVIQGATIWHNASAVPTGFPTTELGSLVQAGPNTGELVPLVVANLIANSFALYVKDYTSVRYVRYVGTKTGNIGGIEYNDTNLASLTNAYDQPGRYTDIDAVAPASGVILGNLATAIGFSTYITNLYNAWVVARNDTVQFATSYCHGNCHGNCHGSRRHR